MSAMEVSGTGALYGQPQDIFATGTQSNEDTAVQASAIPEEDDEQRTLAEIMQEAKKKADQQRERLKLPKNTRYGDAPLEAYARLKRARTQSDVSAAAGYARRRIVQLQAAKRQDSDNADRIQAAINQLQKAVSRAGKKKRDLQHEKLLDVRRARLERESQLRQAQQVKQELAKRKTSRVIREGGYLREAEIDDRFQQQLSATRMELRTQAQALATTTATSLDSAAQHYNATAATASAPTVEIDVQA